MWKSLITVPYELTANQKKPSFWNVISYSMQHWTTSWSDYDTWQKVDFMKQLATTSSVAGRRRSSKNTSQNQTCTKKKSWSLFWWSAVCLIQYIFLNPSKTITAEKYAQQINEMHQKLQHLQPLLVNRMDPILHNAWLQVSQPAIQKLNKLGYKVLPHLPYLPDLSPTNYHFFKHLDNFLPGKRFHNQQKAENAFQEFIKSWNMYFCAIGTNQLISHWHRCVDCNGSYFN